MPCAACGNENPASARFCGSCGAALAATLPCSGCGTTNPATHRFCHGCGQRLEGLPSPAAPLPVPEGERKQVTVLFADVKGSMDLAAGMDPEEWGELMGRLYKMLRNGVTRFGGSVDKFTGDGIMALFGAPVAYEDHARRACDAALHLRSELDTLPFAVRIGLHSGEVVTGPVGDEDEAPSTAIGNTVGLAQRMESIARPGTVCLSAATAALVEGYFEVVDLGLTDVKGAADKMHVFELVRRGPSRTALEVAAARGFTRFVGRESETAALHAAFFRADEGNGQVIGVVAGPGVGKSRLAHEFTESCRANGADVFAAHGLSHAQSVAFLPVLEMLRAQFGVNELDDPEQARGKLAAAVIDLDPALEEALPLLYDFLGISDPNHLAPAIDPEARQRQIFGALDRLRRARSQRRMTVLLIEDLHWLDSGSAAFLENLVNGVPGSRVLVLTTFRPEYHAPWAHRSHYVQLPLLPLGEAATGELLGDLLGSHPSLDGVAALVRQRTGGNPFYIEEVILGLVEDGSLVGRRGSYQLAHTIGDLRIPATVQAVLAARVDRLPDREKAVLQTASVIGRQFTAKLLGRVTPLPSTELDAALRTLVEAELLYETAEYPEAEYAFKHALTEEVAYGSQLTKRRSALHAAVAAALVELDTEKLDERASLIAHHYEVGGEPFEAARWNARAAAWAGFSNAFESARHWRAVRRLTASLEPRAEVTELAINARLALLWNLWRLGAAGEEGGVPFDVEAATLEAEIERFTGGSGVDPATARALMAVGAVQMTTDAIADGFQRCVRAVAIADEIGDRSLRALTRLGAWGLFAMGRMREGVAWNDELLTIIGEDRSFNRGLGITSFYGWARLQRAHIGTYCGRLDEGMAALEDVIELLEQEQDPEQVAWAQRHWALFADLAGVEPEKAGGLARSAVDWADNAGGVWSRIFNRSGLASNLCHRLRWDEAIAVVDEALVLAGDRRIALADVALLLSLRARARVGQGDAAAGRADAEEAIATARRCGAGNYEAQALIQLARARLAHLGPGDASAAETALDEAEAINEALGITVFAPHIHWERAKLAEISGDDARRQQALQSAYRLFLAVGAPGRAAEIAAQVGAG